jgi:Transglutaminase-like superfamily
MNAGPIARFRRLGGERRRLLVRAVLLLTGASAAVAMLPFRTVIRFGSVGLGQSALLSGEDAVWAVEAAARRLPWRTMCIEKGLALQRLLRIAGVDALLHYGVRRSPETGTLEAHVWVTVAGETIIGAEQAPHFAEVASFPR